MFYSNPQDSIVSIKQENDTNKINDMVKNGWILMKIVTNNDSSVKEYILGKHISQRREEYEKYDNSIEYILSQIRTYDLACELEKREGVKAIWIGPEETYISEDDGPASIFIVTD